MMTGDSESFSRGHAISAHTVHIRKRGFADIIENVESSTNPVPWVSQSNGKRCDIFGATIFNELLVLIVKINKINYSIFYLLMPL